MMLASVVLPKPGGPANSRWSGDWPAGHRGSQRDGDVFSHFGLANKFIQRAGPQRGLGVALVGCRARRIGDIAAA